MDHATRGWRWFVAESPRPRRIATWAGASRLVIATVCFGAFMGQFDASIVTLAFPALADHFGAPPAAVEWVSLSYLLALVALLAAVGRLADVIGRKLVYVYGFAVFTAASAACALAPDLTSLVVFRVVQGVGAAMLQANSVALVVACVPRDRMRGALGVQAAAQALGLALGPTVGGVLVGALGWRSVFAINIPIGVVAVVAGHYLLPRTVDRAEPGRFDLAGTLLLGTATTAALLVLSGVSGLAVPVLPLVAVAVAATAALWWWERRAGTPLLDLALLRRAPISRGLLGALCGYLVLFGPLVAVPFASTGSPLATGLTLTALPAGFALAATLGQRVLPGSWTTARVGAWLAAAATLVPVVAPGALVPALALLGFGLGVFTPANNAAVMAALPAGQAGLGGGLVNTTRGLGTALGIAVSTFVLHTGGAHALRTTFAVLAVVAVVSALSTPVLRTGEGATGR
ncbi:MFS transporter [Umezawaea tangerina]|uniref:Putative MFS family arabinose efflux permease n=1 Tax=Umezawaea tangerina TaxID=84725 RepID=A0A2T0SL30_9PSEU|nr:MFS transporter [Umezawaea tangerina]PRY34114.1 putative MFS family arabinose efflux permease [Umezawaea tangerina]